MTRDRSYYRLESNRDLIEEAKYNPNAELSVVLAERLHYSIEKLYHYEDISDESDPV